MPTLNKYYWSKIETDRLIVVALTLNDQILGEVFATVNSSEKYKFYWRVYLSGDQYGWVENVEDGIKYVNDCLAYKKYKIIDEKLLSML